MPAPSELPDHVLDYALRCAANWLEERCERRELDVVEDERGAIWRWVQEHPADD